MFLPEGNAETKRQLENIIAIIISSNLFWKKHAIKWRIKTWYSNDLFVRGVWLVLDFVVHEDDDDDKLNDGKGKVEEVSRQKGWEESQKMEEDMHPWPQLELSWSDMELKWQVELDMMTWCCCSRCVWLEPIPRRGWHGHLKLHILVSWSSSNETTGEEE